MEKLQTPVKFTLDVANIPEDVRREAELKAREVYVMTLLERGIISSGRAARILGISRLEAIALMDKYGISVFAPQTREELEREVAETIAMLEEDKK
jgi:predicted HTH domain antitoxin